jgi:hypothetical protein
MKNTIYKMCQQYNLGCRLLCQQCNKYLDELKAPVPIWHVGTSKDIHHKYDILFGFFILL